MKNITSNFLLFSGLFLFASFTPSFLFASDSLDFSPDYLKLEAGYTSGVDYSGESDGMRITESIGYSTALGVAIGRNYGDSVRLEVLGVYNQARDSSAVIGGESAVLNLDDDYLLSLFLNVYRDSVSSERFMPYVGGGLGFGLGRTSGTATLDGMTMNINENDLVFGVNGGFGVCIVMSENSCLELGYRASYYDFDNADASDILHEGRIGLRLSGF